MTCEPGTCWGEPLRDACDHWKDEAGRARDALVKLAGIVLADAEALDRGYLQYTDEFEGVIEDRASMASRLLRELGLPVPASPYRGTDDHGA